MAALGNTGHSVEELYISAEKVGYLGEWAIKGKYLYYKGVQVIVNGLPVAVRIGSSL